MSLSQIRDAVAELPDKERGALAAWLLDSLPPHNGEDASADAIAEAVRRREELDSGRARSVSAEEFWASVERGAFFVEVIFHPLVKQDLMEAERYYNGTSPKLADEFDEEVRFTLAQAAVNPLRFHSVDHGFRRANLRRFPYHILYEIRAEDLRVMHTRHNKRQPDYGSGRR